MPEFPGGIQALQNFIATNIHDPVQGKKNKVEGKVVVKFIVTDEGYIENVVVLKSVDAELDAEVVSMVQSMPRWQPGKMTSVTEGKIVETKIKTYFTLPVTFSANR